MATKVMCVTGTRADYGIYRPALLELNKHQAFELKLIVTGMHLLAEYGNTIREINNDGLNIAATPSILLKGDTREAMSGAVGLGILHFSEIFSVHRPDYVLLLGDRGEMLAAAVAAHYQNIGIIHLHGGEISGSADDAVRHAISKFAHLHFVSTMASKENLLKMGEAERRIVPIGSLRKRQIDIVNHLEEATRKAWSDKYGLETSRKKALICFHPDSKDPLPYNSQLSSVLDVLLSFSDLECVLIGPNSDSGGDQFRRGLQQFTSKHGRSRYYASLEGDEFLYLMSRVDVMIGNSSSGMIEAPFFLLPFVNVGDRQRGRESADNVINVPYDAAKIREAVSRALQTPRKAEGRNPYDLFPYPEREFVNQLFRLVKDPDLRRK